MHDRNRCFERTAGRSIAGVALGLASLFLGLSAAAIEDPADAVSKTVLENGLEILMLEDHSTPVVSFQVWVRAGSRDESRYTGIAHLFEHMMFKGSKNMPPEVHARLIESRGGAINAYTSRDVTVYFEDVTAESLPLVIDLEAERFGNLEVTQQTLDSEREVVLEERRMRTEDNPDGLAFEALLALVWQAHPYRWPVIGWRSDVEQVTVEACQEFFDHYYAPNNLVIAVVGDFDTDETLARIESRFGGMEPASVPRNPTTEPLQRGERRSTVYFDVQSPILAAGWHAPGSGDPDAEALDVASQILSAGRSSRLYRSLVYEAQVALYAQGGFWELKDAGVFYAFAGVRPGVAIEEVERLFFAQIDEIAAKGVSEEEVAKAVRQLEVGLVENLATAHALASRIGSDTVNFGRVRGLEERLQAILSVTPADVQRVVKKYLVEDQRSVVWVIPPPEAKGIAESGGTAK